MGVSNRQRAFRHNCALAKKKQKNTENEKQKNKHSKKLGGKKKGKRMRDERCWIDRCIRSPRCGMGFAAC